MINQAKALRQVHYIPDRRLAERACNMRGSPRSFVGSRVIGSQYDVLFLTIGLSAFLGDRARATRREIASRARCSYANVTGLPRCPFVRASRKNTLIYLHIKITSVIACYFVTATAANQRFSLPNLLVALHQFDYQMQTLASTAAAAVAACVQPAIIQAGTSARVHTTEARTYTAKNMRALGCTFIHRPLEGVTNLALVEREMTIARQLKIAADVSASCSISVMCGRTYIGLHARNIQQHTYDICKLCKTFVSMCHVLNTSCGFRAADSDEPKRSTFIYSRKTETRLIYGLLFVKFC
uniref:Uncharacterized protein n=1 Tax=Trichogramma kaykai TaxID=54128 RepID=A0ABD2X0V3_9HYME